MLAGPTAVPECPEQRGRASRGVLFYGDADEVGNFFIGEWLPVVRDHIGLSAENSIEDFSEFFYLQNFAFCPFKRVTQAANVERCPCSSEKGLQTCVARNEIINQRRVRIRT